MHEACAPRVSLDTQQAWLLPGLAWLLQPTGTLDLGNFLLTCNFDRLCESCPVNIVFCPLNSTVLHCRTVAGVHERSDGP